MDENVLVDLYLLGSDIYMGPLRPQGLEATCVSIRCFGRGWNRREPEEKALLGKVAGGCGRECARRICWAPMWGRYGLKDEKKLLSV